MKNIITKETPTNNLIKISNEVININPNIKIIVVTKNQSLKDILPIIKIGHQNFGENRVQESINKFSLSLIIEHNLKIHLIGQLQTNKVKLALEHFHCIQSIDREKLVNEIKKYIFSSSVLTKDFFIQINIGNEIQKSGISENNLIDFYHFCLESRLNIVGLMCIPPIDQNPKIFFKKMLNIKNKINSKLLLSMGMSNDYLDAISNKSDMIRIGSKIFKNEINF